MDINFIFDLDGTLLDYEGCSHEAINHPELISIVESITGVKNSEPVDWNLHAAIVGTRTEDWTTHVLRHLQIPPSRLASQHYGDIVHEEILKYFPTMKLMPGTMELLTKLKQYFPQAKMAIATSSQRHEYEIKTSYHPKLREMMHAVVTGDEIQHGKPAPDIFLEAARRLGVDPKTCVVFEDSPAGIQGAKAAGMLAVAIPDDRMPSNFSRFTIADVVLKSLHEFDINKHLKSLATRQKQQQQQQHYNKNNKL
jgi:pseudouridine-5'-monophosphatase